MNWRYGPTPTDPDPGKMWHDGCGGEVLSIDGGLICSCGAQDETADADDGLLAQAAELADLMTRERDVAIAVRGFLLRTGHASVGHLAHESPDEFAVLYESMTSMVAQIPKSFTEGLT